MSAFDYAGQSYEALPAHFRNAVLAHCMDCGTPTVRAEPFLAAGYPAVVTMNPHGRGSFCGLPPRAA